MPLPYYIPYNLSDHVKPIAFIQNTGTRSYSSVSIDFDDDGSIQNYQRNFDTIDYVFNNTGSHTIRVSAYYSGGVTVQLVTVNIYDSFEPYDTTTFFDYISATSNNYNLPHNKTELLQSNDWVTSDNINAAFYTLAENLSYLEQLCHRPDLRGDETLISWLGGTSMSWVPYDYSLLGNADNNFISTYSNQLLEITDNHLDYLSAVGFNNIVDISVQNDNNRGSKLYLIDDTKVVILSSDSSATLMLSTNNIQFNKTFSQPNAIDVDSIGNIYVADVSNNEVYKFKYVNSQLIIQTSVGGTGTASDNYRMNSPNQVRIDTNDRVIISDRDNYAIKIYDSLFGWIDTITLDSTKGKTVALAIDRADNSIFIVTSLKYLLRYSSSGELMSSIQLTVLPSSILQAFVEYAGNYLYVVCTGIVYKFTRDGLFLKIVSEPLTDTLSANDVTSGRSDDHNQTFITSRTKVFRIDSTPPILSIRPYTQSLYYDFSYIGINPKEGVEDHIYNRALYRLIHNHIVFARNVYATFVRGVNTSNTLEYFIVGSRSYNDILSFDVSDDMYIGMNEPVLVNVVNRALDYIYDFQIRALSSIAPRIKTLYTVIPVLS